VLRGIDPLLGPDLLHTLAAMGHGDELVVVDRNFPAQSHNARVHRLDGVDAVRAVSAVLSLLPLDGFVDHPLRTMAIVGSPGEMNDVQLEVLKAASEASALTLSLLAVERHDFYRQTRSAYAVVATGEDRPYGCFILTKGVLPEFVPPH
jgi:L-fucose mutarotase